MNEPDSEQEDEDNCGINCARNGKRSAGSIDREKLTRKLNTVAKTQNQKLLEPVRTAAEVLRNPTKSTTNFNPSLDEFIPFNCEQTVRSATKAVHTGAPLVICKSVSPRALLNRSSFADTVKRATQNALRRSNVKNPCTLFQKGT